jgi:hypothetical protein
MNAWGVRGADRLNRRTALSAEKFWAGGQETRLFLNSPLSIPNLAPPPPKENNCLQYKTFLPLFLDIKKNIHKIPDNTKLVIGIPRSDKCTAKTIQLIVEPALQFSFEEIKELAAFYKKDNYTCGGKNDIS